MTEFEDDLDIREIYFRILIIANKFVTNASLFNLDINLLKNLNPNATQIAKDIKSLSQIVDSLATGEFSDQNLAINAKQATLFMLQIAEAIQAESKQDLNDRLSDLEKLFNTPFP